MLKYRGFTLLELLVVIAIIGLLSTVVLASLNSAREKSADAAVMKQLSEMRTAAELVFSTTGSYDTVCASDSEPGLMYRSAFLQAGGSGSVVCNDSARGHYWLAAGNPLPLNEVGGSAANPGYWAASLPLNNGNWFCVDSRGVASEQPDRGVSHIAFTCDG